MGVVIPFVPVVPDPELVAVADRIRLLMRERGWNLERLSVESKVPFSSLATYLAGNPSEMRMRRAAMVAKALGVTGRISSDR